MRIDEDIKKQTEAILNQIGLNMSSAVNVFFRQIIKEQAIPFMVSARSSETVLHSTKDAFYNSPDTLEALEESKEMKRNRHKYKGYTDMNLLFEEILADD